MGPAAGAGFGGQHANIPGPVPEQGEGLLGDGGKYQFALGAFGKHLAGDGIDDLGDEVVLVDVHPRLLGALVADPGAAELCKTIDVVGLDPQLALDILAHLLAPGFRAEDAGLELELVP